MCGAIERSPLAVSSKARQRKSISAAIGEGLIKSTWQPRLWRPGSAARNSDGARIHSAMLCGHLTAYCVLCTMYCVEDPLSRTIQTTNCPQSTECIRAFGVRALVKYCSKCSRGVGTVHAYIQVASVQCARHLLSVRAMSAR